MPLLHPSRRLLVFGRQLGCQRMLVLLSAVRSRTSLHFLFLPSSLPPFIFISPLSFLSCFAQKFELGDKLPLGLLRSIGFVIPHCVVPLQLFLSCPPAHKEAS